MHHPDIPIPAPSSWQAPSGANLIFLSGDAQPLKPAPADRRFWVIEEPPTDKPIFRSSWDVLCTRHIERGGWHVYYWDHNQPSGQRLGNEQWLVVDDQGSAVPLSWEAADQAREYFEHSGHIEHAVWELQEAQRATARRAQREAEVAQNTRDLLQPPPAQVSIDIDAPDDWCAFTVRIDGDRAPVEAPNYRIHVRGNDPLCVSHAQLSALLAAAQTLCKPVPGPHAAGTVRGAPQ